VLKGAPYVPCQERRIRADDDNAVASPANRCAAGAQRARVAWVRAD
jgi:hypothetical protein